MAFGLIAANFLAHLLYLTVNCPIDLAEDEAYYWDWSRQLDICYFSKGPMTAYLIGASCAVFGNTMAAVRTPALLLGAGLLCCIYWMARRLFGSERIALGAVALTMICPMIQAAGLIMTTDPPFLFFWALATCFAIEAIFYERRWAWLGAGTAAGCGFLAKYSMPLWFVGIFVFLAADRQSRKLFRTRWPWFMLLTFGPFTLPMLMWNAQRGWVTILHVSEDVGIHGGARFVAGNAIDFWIQQAAVVGPMLFMLIFTAVIWSLGRALNVYRDDPESLRHEKRASLFLLTIGLTVLVATMLSSLRKHPAANWPAGSYVTLVVLAALYLSRMLRQGDGRRFAFVLLIVTAVSGAIQVIAAHEAQALYPALARWNARHPHRTINVARIDPTARLRGWRGIGRRIGGELEQMRKGSLVIAGDYQTAAAMAFYAPEQPKTYCIGSYFARAPREPFSQYDFWADRRLDPSSAARLGLLGRDAVYIGEMNEDVWDAFDSPPQRLEDIVVTAAGFEIRRMQIWKCSGFRGIAWPGWEGRYNK